MKIHLIYIRVLCFIPLYLCTTIAAYADLSEGSQAEWASISPDGQTIIFTSNASGNDDLWVTDMGGKNPRQLLNWKNSGELHPNWSPDGKRIIFSSNRNSIYLNIWTIAADGTDPKQLTVDNNNNMSGQYSPNGETIAFLSKRTGKNELWIMNADGNQQKAIGLQSIIVNDPSWSPQGDQIVYVGCKLPTSKDVIIAPSTTSCNLFIIAIDASRTKQITFGNFHDWEPDWGINGIVFKSNRDNDQALWLVDQDGKNLIRLNPNTNGGNYPKWDITGNVITFSRFSTTASNVSQNIWQTDLSGNEFQITSINGFISEGDTNTDGELNCEDLYIVKESYGQRLGQDGYNFRADINSDEVVNIRDLAFVSRKLPIGATCP